MIETLVASSILLIGISAAGSLSLSMVAQEEIAEQANRAAAYLDNATTLFRLGVAPTQIGSLLPPESAVASLDFTNDVRSVPDLGAVMYSTVTVDWKSSSATSTKGTNRWTGGDPGDKRSISVEVINTNPEIVRSQYAPRASAIP